MIVIDASAVVEICLGSAIGKTLAREILRVDEELVAPELLPLEVIHALRKQLNLKLIAEAKATEGFRVYCLMPIQLLSHAELVQRIWQLKPNMTAYDASYVALAEKLDAPIWACDRKYEKTPLHKAKFVFFDSRPIIVTPL